MKDDPRFSSSAARGLAMLERLAERGGGVKLSDLARGCDLPIATAQRLLDPLLTRGWVERSPDKTFRATAKTVDLMHAYLRADPLALDAWPVLLRLRALTKLTVALSAPHGVWMIDVHHLPAAGEGFERAAPGRRQPRRECAQGLCLELDDDAGEGAPRPWIARRSPQSPERLAVAAPIRRRAGGGAPSPVAALSIEVDVQLRSSRSIERDLVPPLLEATRALSRP